MLNSISGHYTNTLKVAITSTSELDKELRWLIQNKPDKTGWNLAAIYGTSPMQNTNFPSFAFNCYLNKIRLAIPFTAMSEVDATIKYNLKQTDPRKKIVACITEYEDYTTSGGDVEYYKNLLKSSSLKLKEAGMLLGAYQGWSKSYGPIAQYVDFLLLHAYRTSAQISKPEDVYNYMKTRLVEYAKELKAIGKVLPVSVLVSTEKVFSQDYFKTADWNAALVNFMNTFNAKATPDMKQFLIINGTFVFVSATSKVSKPLV